jgi:hypothetical protein
MISPIARSAFGNIDCQVFRRQSLPQAGLCAFARGQGPLQANTMTPVDRNHIFRTQVPVGDLRQEFLFELAEPFSRNTGDTQSVYFVPITVFRQIGFVQNDNLRPMIRADCEVRGPGRVPVPDIKTKVRVFQRAFGSGNPLAFDRVG